jgi:hypothetical protein
MRASFRSCSVTCSNVLGCTRGIISVVAIFARQRRLLPEAGRESDRSVGHRSQADGISHSHDCFSLVTVYSASKDSESVFRLPISKGRGMLLTSYFHAIYFFSFLSLNHYFSPR